MSIDPRGPMSTDSTGPDDWAREEAASQPSPPSAGKLRRPQKQRIKLKLQTSTLWYYPSQQYSDEAMGDPYYEGRTPAYVIWNCLQRYTREGDQVVDPFCGGGTTLDVARSLERKARGFDVAPHRADIESADARKLPLADESVDFVFMDPPYSTHVSYSEAEGCIGKLDASEPGYFEAMNAVFAEAERVLRDRRYLAVYVSDSYKKRKGFVPIGMRLFELLEKRFRPVDHVAVVRGNRKLEDPRFHKVAADENFFLRGFNHLLLFKKEKG
ncbi:MAG: adenine-specific DNA-methyltransferase [Gammaproteobacteria bacterium]|jgi:adenine-specific DNA-methyltransferase